MKVRAESRLVTASGSIVARSPILSASARKNTFSRASSRSRDFRLETWRDGVDDDKGNARCNNGETEDPEFSLPQESAEPAQIGFAIGKRGHYRSRRGGGFRFSTEQHSNSERNDAYVTHTSLQANLIRADYGFDDVNCAQNDANSYFVNHGDPLIRRGFHDPGRISRDARMSFVVVSCSDLQEP